MKKSFFCLHLEQIQSDTGIENEKKTKTNPFIYVISSFPVPLVSRILPSDVCKIHKSGCSIRLDTTLVDFSDMRWERGDISFIFRGDKSPKESLTVLDNEFQCYQRVRYEETETEIEDEVDILMSSDILAAQMSTKSINFVRAQSGWIFREDKKVRTKQ